MTKEASIVGGVLIAFGIFLLAVSRFHIVAIIYGGIAIVFGVIIILYNKEDKIEERKDLVKKKMRG